MVLPGMIMHILVDADTHNVDHVLDAQTADFVEDTYN